MDVSKHVARLPQVVCACLGVVLTLVVFPFAFKILVAVRFHQLQQWMRCGGIVVICKGLVVVIFVVGSVDGCVNVIDTRTKFCPFVEVTTFHVGVHFV